MARKSVRETMNGNIGFFWPQAGEEISFDSAPERGYLEQKGNEHLRIKTLEEDPSSAFFRRGRDRETKVESLVGQLEDSGVLILDVTGRGTSNRIGGSRASVSRYQARCMIKSVKLDELNSSKILGFQLFFPGITQWIGNEATSVDPEFDEEGRQKRLTIKVSTPRPLPMQLNEKFTIELNLHWEYGGTEDRRTLYTPFTLAVKSTEPVDFMDILEPLISLQDLLNLAHRGFVQADGGRAFVDSSDTSSKPLPFWNHQTMELPLGATPPRSSTEVPLFNLATIGGADAIPRWVELEHNHPRLTSPLVDRFRFGPPTTGTYLRDIGAAIDYWRSFNKGKSAWAEEKLQPLALANYAGEPFAQWLGVDTKEWAERLWSAYNSSKHYNRLSTHDEEENEALAMSGAVLLTATALKHISPVDWTVENLLESYWLNNVRRRVRALFAEESDT